MGVELARARWGGETLRRSDEKLKKARRECNVARAPSRVLGDVGGACDVCSGRAVDLGGPERGRETQRLSLV